MTARTALRTTHLLYLHGFRSSPHSTKARRMAREVQRLQAEGMAIVWRCPQLPPAPAEARGLIDMLTAGWPSATMAVVGSSLGGFYATVLAEARGCRAVLLNPAVDPARDLAAHIGTQTAWHDPALSFDFTAADVAALRAMTPAAITRPERYHTVIATGDEVLDWREMRARYAGSCGVLVEGSDHALGDFDLHLPGAMLFLGLDGP
ncbi:MAG TPA: YqiA/YcfP family alpha/beta fold hydrolase [Methylibium sp.]|uniref:YqiA/YcfP family alpha/beta fold hydrolase n=1 Tax=Methylibium sp. TaxID=2067992 RepID=UPI002DB9D394|nr:YqiA/YcfP family alpha/beta fold hydrolase [Methylibium sp.]HEU4457941.1 YqiA/YcfP family alpha/beta fold hydrolase [Methylibium sp.]